MSELRSRALGGVLWRALSQLAVQALGIVITLALARMLSPRAFGLLAMAGSVSALVALFSGFGLGSALVQRESIDEADRRSVFTVSVAVSVLLFAIISALAVPAARFYGEPSLHLLLPLLALELPLAALGSVHRINLRRALRFDTLARVDILGAVVGGVLGVGAAAFGWGVLSLVVRVLAAVVAQNLALFAVEPWRPRLAFDSAIVRGLSGFGLRVTGMELLGYLYLNVDNILIGRLLGDQPLGLYSRAYTLKQLPPRVVGGSMGEVMFSALSAIQRDHERVRGVVLRALGVIGLASFPLCALLFVCAGPLAEGVLGSRWEGFAPILQLLSVAAAAESFVAFTRAVYRAMDRVDLELRVSVPGPIVLGAAIWLGAAKGLEGAALAFVVASYLLALPRIWLALRVVELSSGRALGAVLPSLACALAAGAVAHYAAAASAPAGPIAQLFVAALSLTGAYGLALGLLRPAALRDVLGLLRARQAP